MDPDVIFNGPVGERWVNHTGKVCFQFVPRLVNTCGACFQYFRAISSSWPIPLHDGCRCRSLMIEPGGLAPYAFVDFRELLSKMPRADQARAIGASNYRLLRKGLVKWEDVVTRFHVRGFRQVVVLAKVSRKSAVDAGVRPAVVDAALASGGQLSEAELDRLRRIELVEGLRAARVSQDALVAALERGMKAATAFAGGVGVQSAPTAIAALPHAAELAAELAKWRPARRRLKAEL